MTYRARLQFWDIQGLFRNFPDSFWRILLRISLHWHFSASIFYAEVGSSFWYKYMVKDKRAAQLDRVILSQLLRRTDRSCSSSALVRMTKTTSRTSCSCPGHTRHKAWASWRHQMETLPRYWLVTGHRWIPLTKASDVELWCFLWSAPE